MEETLLASEATAQRQMNMATARTWAVVNPSVQNALGAHPSYIIVPGVNSIPYVGRASQVRQRAGFINNHFWATRYRADELYAAGAYPNQSLGGGGLPRGRPTTNRSSIRTSSSGTRWASRTSRGRRNGR